MTLNSVNIFTYLKDRVQGKAAKGERRSSAWPTVRKAFLAEHPACAVCGGTKKIEVHHIIPFSVAPNLELDPENLITLCEAWKFGVNCHLLFGHRGSYRKFNSTIFEDTTVWRDKLSSGRR